MLTNNCVIICSIIFIFHAYIGSDTTLEGEASYKLGLAYEKNNDSETALIVSKLKIFLIYNIVR